ncbi:MAG: DUF3501 family protein, partial [Betaproteobacteria bacterium]|nr:DUF3501 family protein [Betaproteobacteria bacterium]
LKATMLIEYEDEAERREALARLRGVEGDVWLRVDGFPEVRAIADEDLARENEEKTSSVHFLRFEFTPEMVAALRAGRALAAGVDHPNYAARIPALPEPVRAALVADLA